MLCSTRLLLTLLSLFFLETPMLFAQGISYLNPHEFSGIKSEGEIPEDFRLNWAARFQSSYSSAPNANLKNSDKKKLEEFWGSQYYMVDGIMQSGRLVFNHPASIYLNNIKDELLKDDPAMRDQLRVYLYRSPSVNAFIMADGIILFNVGIFAYAHTEAELAFAMAHEIQHYQHEHLLDRFQKREEMLRQNVREYRSLHPLEKEELLTMQSQEHEFEADELGLKLYLNSRYNREAPENLLTILHESYMPYGRKEVSADFLATKRGRLPEVFFRDSVAPITREEDYFDDTRSHPNIARRRAALQEWLKNGKGGTTDFVQPKAEFMALRDLMRFERVRELVLYGFYGDALYDIYYLRDQFPDSRFLDLAEVKALYGLAGFKCKRAFNDVAKSTSRLEGPSQQAHHILKQFDKKQLAGYALNAVRETMLHYPNERQLEIYAKELTSFLRVECDLSSEEFKVTATSQPPFEANIADYRNERAYFRAQQQHYRDFYKYLLREDFESGWLGRQLEAHQWLVDSIAKHRNMDARTKHDLEDLRVEEWEDGTHIKVQKLVMLDPLLVLHKEDGDMKDYHENFEKEEEFKNALPGLLKEAGIDATILFSAEMGEGDVEKYNEMAQLKEWINETGSLGSIHIKPTCMDMAPDLQTYSGARYICTVRGVVADGKDTYKFTLYDLEQGRVVYHHSDEQGFNLSLRDLLKETTKDLERIHN